MDRYSENARTHESGPANLGSAPIAVGHPFKDEPEFIRGIGVGIVDAAAGFIEFVKAPGAVPRLAHDVQSSLATAGNYYREKLQSGRCEEITHDAKDAVHAGVDWLNAYGRLSSLDRGKIVGGLVLQSAATEAIGAAGSTICKRIPAFAQKTEFAAKDGGLPHETGVSEQTKETAPEVDMATERGRHDMPPGHPDAERVMLVNYDASAQFADSVEHAVENLPQEVRSLLNKEGIPIVVAGRADSISTRATENTRGLYKSDPLGIYIFENFRRGPLWLTEAETIPLVVRHEVGHALDCASKSGVKLSDAPAFVETYRQDLQEITPSMRRRFDYYAKGDRQGRMEVFAEAYALVHCEPVAHDSGWRTLFCKTFPRMVQAVKDARLP